MWSSERRRLLRGLTALPVLGTLTACGFELRQPPPLQINSIALQGFPPHSPLERALRQQLELQIRVLPGPDGAQAVLQSLGEARDKVVSATTAAAQVRGFTLRLKFTFTVHTPAGRELIPRAEMLLTRDITYSENFALAKEQEETELYDDMQADVITQVLRRLAAIKL